MENNKEFKMCADSNMAIEILDFIKRGYIKHHGESAGVQKYIEALNMGIDALNTKACSNGWINVSKRLPTEDEYLHHHNDGTDGYKRLLIAYQTDTIEYNIGCYDGYKWFGDMKQCKINNVIAWKPFDEYG